MSFNPIVFTREIPPTVPSQSAPYTSSASATTAGSSIFAGNQQGSSIAATLITQFNALIDTANYLQSVIFAMNPGLGISIDPSADPDTGRALSTIYNGNVPSAVTLSMYGYTLDAELGAAQINLAAGTSSSVQANPYQYQALLGINKAVESQLTSSNNFSAQSALLLRRLKADVISNSNIVNSLSDYPAASNTPINTSPNSNVITASTVDVSPQVQSILQNNIDQTGQTYSSMFQVLSQPDPIAADIGSVVSVLATMNVPNLIQMSSLLQMTSSGTITQGITGVSSGLSAFVYPQMLTQSSSMLFQLDQIAQMAIGPASNMSNSVGAGLNALLGASASIGSLVGVIRTMNQSPATQTNGPLAGMPLNNSSQSGLAIGINIPTSLSKLNLSTGIHELLSLFQFSITSSQNASQLHQDSFQRLSARSNSDSNSLVQLLAASASMISLTSVVSSLITAQKGGGNILAAQSPTSQLSIIGTVLSTSQTGNGTTYTVQGGVVHLNPPIIPAPTVSASVVFAKSGIQTSLTGLTSN